MEMSGGKYSFDAILESYIEKYVALWHGSTVDPPEPAQIYSPADQRDNEREADRLNNILERALRDYPDKKRRQSAWRDRMVYLLRRYGTRILGFPESHFDIIFSREYFEATRAFIREARAFDVSIETQALGQALRNVWIMNCLQLFLGRQPALSPSILAYSLLYPYTDNHLDRRELPIKSKKAACRRLGRRLSGRTVDSEDIHESTVYRLVEMIEDEFPRSAFPEVYFSLLAIHTGQIQSLRQQDKSDALDEEQLLRISIRKGGSSVLADGWLIEGSLKDPEADFCFGYGVALQLLDDLQDLNEDRTSEQQTLFTLKAAIKQMDRVTNQLWAFIHCVMHPSNCFDSAGGLELRALIRRSGRTMIFNSMAEHADSYPGEYLYYMEQFSPLSFTYIRNNAKEVRARLEKIWTVLARRRRLRSIFDLLG